MQPNSDKKETKEVTQTGNAISGIDFYNTFYASKDKNFVFIYQKVKKLAAAVYMITNFFDDNEPIKWSLRTLSTELLKKNIALTDTLFANSGSTHSSIRDITLETVSLLEVASFAGLVSDMNVTVLKKEFSILLERIEVMTKVTSQSGVLDTAQFFAVEDPTQNTQSRTLTSPVSHISNTQQIKDNSRVFYPTPDHLQSHEEFEIENRMKLREFSPVAVKKNKRQSAIISLLKRKKEIMIKDVVGIILDCSEKTIQRELLALVDEGMLVKEGERRWTKYSLAKG